MFGDFFGVLKKKCGGLGEVSAFAVPGIFLLLCFNLPQSLRTPAAWIWSDVVGPFGLCAMFCPKDPTPYSCCDMLRFIGRYLRTSGYVGFSHPAFTRYIAKFCGQAWKSHVHIKDDTGSQLIAKCREDAHPNPRRVWK